MISLPRLVRLTAIELEKMLRQRLALFVLAIPVLVALLVPQGLWLTEHQGAQGFLAMTTALKLSLLLGCFLLLLHAAVSIAWERSEKTLRNQLVGPVERCEVLLSRWLALQGEMLALLALVTGAAYFSTATHYAFEDIRGEAIEPLFYAPELLEHLSLGMAYFLPAAMALVTVGIMISSFCATPVVATAIAVGGILCLDVAKSVFSGRADWVAWLFTSYLPTLFDQTSYLHGVSAMANGIGDVLWPGTAPQHWLVWIVPAVTTAVCLGISLLSLQRRDYAE